MSALSSNPGNDSCHFGKLSEELLREIAKHIRQDSFGHDTLRRLAFVCKQFRKVLLPEAYERVAFSGFESLKTFTQVLRQCDTFPKKHIRSLHLSFTPASISDELSDPSSCSFFSTVSFKNEQLKSRAAHEFLSTLWITPVLQVLQGITTLAIKGISVTHHVVDNLAAFPCLAFLSYHIYEDHEASFIDEGQLLPPPLSLSTLRRSPTSLCSITVIATCERRPCGCCGSIWESETSVLSRLLIASSHSLEQIVIRGDHFRLGLHEFYMHHFPSLTKLILHRLENDSKTLNHFIANHSMNPIDLSIGTPSREVSSNFLKTNQRPLVNDIPGFFDLEEPKVLDDDIGEMGWTVSDFAVRLEHRQGEQAVTELAVVNASSPCIISSMCQRQLYIRVLNIWWTILDIELEVSIFDSIPPLMSLEVLRLGSDLELSWYHDSDSDESDSSETSSPNEPCWFHCSRCDSEDGPRDQRFYRRLESFPSEIGIDVTLKEKYPSLGLIEQFSLCSRNGCTFFWSFTFLPTKLGWVIHKRLMHPHTLGGEKVKWEMERGMSLGKNCD